MACLPADAGVAFPAAAASVGSSCPRRSILLAGQATSEAVELLALAGVLGRGTNTLLLPNKPKMDFLNCQGCLSANYI